MLSANQEQLTLSNLGSIRESYFAHVAFCGSKSLGRKQSTVLTHRIDGESKSASHCLLALPSAEACVLTAIELNNDRRLKWSSGGASVEKHS